jgi:hypothetical protein
MQKGAKSATPQCSIGERSQDLFTNWKEIMKRFDAKEGKAAAK